MGILLTTVSYAQDIKYQGLLWEITGNGLEKPSYLYGTMHVSRKIAFNLDDIFFESLNKADMVAVESMPDAWVDDLFKRGEMGYGGSVARSGGFSYGSSENTFYSSAFKMNFPNKNDVISGMFGQYQLINGLLYRSEGMADFEEDTYLDMFIYQTGKRFNKGTYSLEGSDESRSLVEKAMLNAPKKEVDEWLKKLIEKKNIRTFDILQDAYRDRNIGLIDSLNRAMYTNHYMEHMLFKRNENMVDSMETLMKKGCLFTGVGAAHLPGEDGMIDMLIKRGYTLKPLFSEQTERGKALKSTFEDKFITKKYISNTTEDGFITLNCTGKLYEIYADGGSFAIAPDYDNGSYIAISRLYNYNLLRGNNSEQLNENDLEKLLFEFIPGDILSKKVLETPFPGFDIENKTKTGHHQRYRFYVTPLETIIIKMDGKNEFVKRESDKVFSGIKFNTNRNSTQKVSSLFGGFEVEMPGYAVTNNTQYKGKRFMQAYDEVNKHYAFLTEIELNDISYIEEDSFELAYMMEAFCENMETEMDENSRYEINNNVPSFYSFTVLDSTKNERLYLNTRLLGERYYLVGFLGEESAANDFFKTVKITPFAKYKQDFEEQIDTNLFYTVVAPKRNKIGGGYYRGYYQKEDKAKDYEGFNKNQTYTVNSNEQIFIKLIKYHDWFVEDNIDSLWIDQRRKMEKDGFTIVKDKVYEKDSTFYFEGSLIKDKSLRMIKFKYIQKNGCLYALAALTHQNVELSPFVDTFFQTFAPKDTVIGISPFSNKSKMYLSAIESQDSILLTARSFINFEDKDYESVKKIFQEQEFGEDWIFVKDLLLDEICHMKNPEVIPFLEKLYIDSYENSNYQVDILQTLIYKQTKAGNQKMINLLKQDIPIVDGGGRYLWRLVDSAKITNPIVSDLLEFSNIPDYKYDIQDILAYLVKYGNLSPKKYKSYKKQFLYEGKIELKRAIGKQNQGKPRNSYYSSNYNTTRELNRYVTLLYPFRKEKKIKEFLDNVQKIEATEVRMNFIELKLLNKEPIEPKIIAKIAEDDKQRYNIYALLRKYKSLDLMADSLKSVSVLAKGLLNQNSYYSEKVDTMYHLLSEKITISGVVQNVHYYYQKTTRETSYYNKDKESVTITAVTWEDEEKITPYNFYDVSMIKEKDETEAEIMEKLRKKIQLRDRKRISNYSKSGSGYNSFEETAIEEEF